MGQASDARLPGLDAVKAAAISLVVLIHAAPPGPEWYDRHVVGGAARLGVPGFLLVTGYPRRKPPFYSHPDPARPEYSNSFDSLLRGTELVAGGQRPHLYAD